MPVRLLFGTSSYAESRNHLSLFEQFLIVVRPSFSRDAIKLPRNNLSVLLSKQGPMSVLFPTEVECQHLLLRRQGGA